MLNTKLCNLLKNHNLKISFAESCTGGLLAKSLTDVSGSSAVISESYVTYSEGAKEKILNVAENVIKKHSVVSFEVALLMAKGLFDIADCDIAVSVTGVAGPDSDDYNNPVGLVYAGICTKDFSSVKRLNLSGSRHRIRQKTKDIVFAMVCKYISSHFKQEND